MTLQSEFQAVVLAAGKGSRMLEITTGKPKCLLPVGPKPLIWYPLYKLQESGFTDVIVIVLENQKSEIQSALDKTEMKIKIDFVTISSNDDLGTADSLRLISNKLNSDVIVLSCDLITDISFKHVLKLFRSHNASLTSLLFHQNDNSEMMPGPKSKYKPEKDLIGIDSTTNRLVFVASASDFETELKLPRKLFKKHPNIKFFSNLLDSHLYVMKNWIVKYLSSDNGFTTIKGELLPHVVKKQLSKPRIIQENKSTVTKYDEDDRILTFSSKCDEDQLLIREVSSFNDHTGDFAPIYHGDSIRCYAYLAAQSDFGMRINTLPNYWTINKKIVDKWNSITDNLKFAFKSPKSDVKSTQVDDCTIIWEGAKLNEKTSFKNSIISSNCEINSLTRVFNSILMSNVKISEKVALENCIVCDGVKIGPNSKISNCLIGNNHQIEENSEHDREVLTESERFMEF